MNEEMKANAVEISDEEAKNAAGGGPVGGGGGLDGTLVGNTLTFTCQQCGKQNSIVLTAWTQPPCGYCGYINKTGPIGVL